MTTAPIVLFVYNRPWHVQKTVEALQANCLANESDLFIFSDGPKGSYDSAAVNAVRDFIRRIRGFRSLVINESTSNRGLSKSIIRGVREMVNNFGKVIVLEDDLITSPFFLSFMNEALELYENEEKVLSITGYTYPVTFPLPETFLLRDPGCWGWATWKRGWLVFDEDGQALFDALSRRGLLRQFNYNNSYHYSKMLEDSISGKNESWAIRWYASAFLGDYLTLYPGTSLVHNIGNDGSGVHSCSSNLYDVNLSDKSIILAKIPVCEDEDARNAFEIYFRSLKRSIVHRVFGTIAKLKG